MKSHQIARARRGTAAGVVLLTALSLAACSEEVDAGSGEASSASTGASAEAAAALATHLQPLDAYPVPTEPIDASPLVGETVYYVPITQQSPQFSITGQALTEALGTVGINTQTCNGNGTPTDISACIGQAVNAGAIAIVADAISYGLASNAYDSARAAGVPVIIGNQVPDEEHPADETLAWVEGAGSEIQVALADWVAVDSGGAADVLINQSMDGTTPGYYVADAQARFDEVCPGCTTTINEVTSANFSLIPTSTSAALLKDPNIDYVNAQFAQNLQGTQSGVEQAGRIGKVKGTTGSVQLGGLQALASGTFLAAAGAQASVFQGWVDADAAIRMALGAELPEYTIPYRLFTQENIGDVTLSEEAEASGEWFGPATFRADFATLWGAS